jgi:predicted HTH transcriptional regulator
MLTAFLNSQGGALYIGVEDSGEVVGVELNRKEQDEFLLFVKDFVEKIRPAVDLVNREEVASTLSRSASSLSLWSLIRFSRGST